MYQAKAYMRALWTVNHICNWLQDLLGNCICQWYLLQLTLLLVLCCSCQGNKRQWSKHADSLWFQACSSRRSVDMIPCRLEPRQPHVDLSEFRNLGKNIARTTMTGRRTFRIVMRRFPSSGRRCTFTALLLLLLLTAGLPPCTKGSLSRKNKSSLSACSSDWLVKHIACGWMRMRKEPSLSVFVTTAILPDTMDSDTITANGVKFVAEPDTIGFPQALLCMPQSCSWQGALLQTCCDQSLQSPQMRPFLLAITDVKKSKRCLYLYEDSSAHFTSAQNLALPVLEMIMSKPPGCSSKNSVTS